MQWPRYCRGQVAGGVGIEYNNAGGREQLFLFIEGGILGELSLPYLPAVTLDPGFGARIVYEHVDGPDGKVWQESRIEDYFYTGNPDEFRGQATEISVTTGVQNNGQNVDGRAIINALKNVRFSKRIMLDFHTYGLGIALKKQRRVKALMEADYEQIGANIMAALTLGLDFGSLKRTPKLSDLAEPIAREYKTLKSESLLDYMLNLIRDWISGGSRAEGYAEFFSNILNDNVISEAFLHVEIGGGVAGGGKIGAGAKVQLDAAGEVAMVYRLELIDRVREMLSNGSNNGILRDSLMGKKEGIQELARNSIENLH